MREKSAARSQQKGSLFSEVPTWVCSLFPRFFRYNTEMSQILEFLEIMSRYMLAVQLVMVHMVENFVAAPLMVACYFLINFLDLVARRCKALWVIS